jgi:hypothetical protein
VHRDVDHRRDGESSFGGEAHGLVLCVALFGGFQPNYGPVAGQ